MKLKKRFFRLPPPSLLGSVFALHRELDGALFICAAWLEGGLPSGFRLYAPRTTIVMDGPDDVRDSSLNASAPDPKQPRLLDRVRLAVPARHYSPRTEKAYVGWIRRFIFYHRLRHPDGMGEAEITEFLSSLATRARVSASTQNQALAALLFLYRHVLGRDLDWLQDVVRAKRPVRLPVVLSREEVAALLRHVRGT